ncbi:MAG: hypothetical protein U0232_04925 [Thermomicrobiales bacterium]
MANGLVAARGRDVVRANPTTRRSSPPRRPTVALGALYDRHARLIYRYCYARLGTREAAEDATTEVS